MNGYESFRLYPLKNSKKFSKNIKFGLQACFNMEIMMNGLDRQFELRIWRNGRKARANPCFAKYSRLTLYIYIYRERERELAYGT